MGIIIDTELAGKSTCTCHAIGPTDEPEDIICFSPGIIGTLSNKQDREFCKTKIIIRDNGIKKRVEKFRDASDVCEKEIKTIPKGERLLPRLECMSRELSKRGIKA